MGSHAFAHTPGEKQHPNMFGYLWALWVPGSRPANRLHPAPAVPTGTELVKMLGEMPVVVEGKQVWQQEKGKILFFNFPLTFFRQAAVEVFLTMESKAELTGSNIPWSSMLFWVESMNFWLQK